MSAFYDNDTESVAWVQATWIGNCCTISAACLVVFEHIATLPQELELIWGRGFMSTILIFHANRWVVFAWAVVQLLHINPGGPHSEAPLLRMLSSCVPLQLFGEALQILCLSIWAVFSAVRTYAISDGSWLPMVPVLALALVPVGVNLYGYFGVATHQIQSYPGIGGWCVELQRISEVDDTRLTISSRLCAVVADLLVLAMTWIKTYVIIRDARICGVKMPLAEAMIRDGTFYFMVNLCINVIQVVGNLTNAFTNVFVFITPWVKPNRGKLELDPDSQSRVTSIIISRFLLNLRGVAYGSRSDGLDKSCPPIVAVRNDQEHGEASSGSLRFGSFIGNMGAELVHEEGEFDGMGVEE